MQNIADMSIRTRLMMVVVQCSGVIGLLAASMFLSAGTRNWPRAWVLLGVYAVCFLATSTTLFLKVPELMDARRVKHDNVEPWDRPLVLAYQALYFPTFIVSGLDERWDWSSLPAGVSLLGLALIVFFFGIATWSPLVNRHLEPYVRIQTDRDHQVCDTGPYQIVRHPTYIGLALFFMGIPLALGSVWGLVPAIIAAIILWIRTRREDQILQAKLPGYQEYTQRVQYRWLPGIW